MGLHNYSTLLPKRDESVALVGALQQTLGLCPRLTESLISPGFYRLWNIVHLKGVSVVCASQKFYPLNIPTSIEQRTEKRYHFMGAQNKGIIHLKDSTYKLQKRAPNQQQHP